MYALLLVYILLFGLLYGSYHPPRFRKIFPWIKLSTSICFVLIACYSAFLGHDYTLFVYMLPAFLLAALGDFLLGLAHAKDSSENKAFLMGTLSFLAAHIIFYAALSTLDPIRASDFIIPAAVMTAVIFISNSKNIHLGRMKIPGIIYAFFVGLLFSKGLMVLLFQGISTAHILMFSGSFLFLISDMILIFLYFHISPPKCLAFANLSTYYTAMALLGLSMYPFCLPA